MWKYIKGTEKDFEKAPQECDVIVKPLIGEKLFYTSLFGETLNVYTGLVWLTSVHKNYDIVAEKEGTIVAQRTWLREPPVETKQEQQPLPSTEDINVADAMEQSSTPSIGSMMNPSAGLPKIKLDVKKPIFDKGDDKEVKFIYSNNIYSVFELTDGDIFCIESSKVDTYFYNKPDVKTTEQLISDAWTYARNDGSLWASPTQLYYIAIKELIKHNVIDVSKTHEVPDDTTK